MPVPFTRSTYEARLCIVRAALARRQIDALVVTHPPNVRYLTGLAASAGAALVTGTDLYLITDFRYAAAVERLLDEAALHEIVTPMVGEQPLEQATASLVAEGQLARVGVEAAHVTLEQHNRLAALQPGASLVPVSGVVEAARVRKDDREIAIFREAAARLSDVATTVLREVVKPGRTEMEIAAEIDWRLRRAGFSRPAFDTIVASGPNSALPHAYPTERTLADGEATVLDFGGVYNGYCVDLSRTVLLGSPSAELRRMHEAVSKAQQAALAILRPGVAPEEVDAAARKSLGRDGLEEAFGHSTGHGLGLEVHEAPRLGRRRPDMEPSAPLETGMVCTVEPGVYVVGVGGVRIEDDVLVTTDGCELLTRVDRAWRVR
ncbi:MAG: M24 family metallopeptidase [Luteitalea sp.]|nr:M24 family metallopeptidase [Luteitalea sp.]